MPVVPAATRNSNRRSSWLEEFEVSLYKIAGTHSNKKKGSSMTNKWIIMVCNLLGQRGSPGLWLRWLGG